MANYMVEVAKMLGVELYEEFQICGNGKATVKLTESGLEIVTNLGKLIDNAECVCLTKLLTGGYIIKRKPWKPLKGEVFYAVAPVGTIDHYIGTNAPGAYSLYKLGNCYKSKEEAEADRDKWVSFYASDEVLEV
jgi:hypothetical protein